MKILFVSVLMLLSVLTIVAVYKDGGGSLEDINEDLKPIEEVLFNITSDTIPYTSPMNTNISIDKIIYNIVHSIIYSTSVNVMTCLGGSINILWDYLSKDLLLKVLNFMMWIIVIWIISKMFLPVVASYIFIGELIEEKWNVKLAWYYKILLTILLWSMVFGFIALIFFIV